MSVCVFLSGGPIINVVSSFCRHDVTRPGYTFNPHDIATIDNALKNTKVRLTHLRHSRKFRALGPPANSPESRFLLEGTGRITVAEYFKLKSRTDRSYPILKYPQLPTINVGSSSHPVLVPMELVDIFKGQNFSSKCTPRMTAEIVKLAAVRPQERFQNLEGSLRGGGEHSILSTLQSDETASAFGVNSFDIKPLQVAAALLPPPVLRYGGNREVSPLLSGSWNVNGRFAKSPPNPVQGKYHYGTLLICRNPPQNYVPLCEEFHQALERDGSACGLGLQILGPVLLSSGRDDEILDKLTMMKKHGARIAFVMLDDDAYSLVKLHSDQIGLVSQCLKWKNIERPPRGYHSNVLLKVNTKLGGTNHTLASLLPAAPSGPSVFQDPPASLSWAFDVPSMLVGIDVSHAEPGSDRRSVAAVVGSVNGQASQYAARISAQAPRAEIVEGLEDAMISLLETFRERNQGRLPVHVIVYRDGVGDGQFDEVLDKELPCIKGALDILGAVDSKVTIVICQKRHNTRLVYEKSDGDRINCCPGLCVDARGRENSICSASFNEFYLNSHTAIQGTAKACKYSLIYDEIGFKLSELELLTYWSCYLYARCNKSVSYATPAYYAHWASRRAKYLFSAGATDADLENISNQWRQARSMFFI